MLKQFSKCIIFKNFFLCLLFSIFLQKIPTVFTYNVSEDFDIEIEPVEKVDVSPYIYPFISFLNLSVSNVAPEKTKLDLDFEPISPINTLNFSEKLKELMNKTEESFKKFEEKDLNLSQEITKLINQFQPRSDILKDDEESNGNFLMKLLLNFYITPIVTWYKPLLNQEVKYYKNLINVSKQSSNDTSIISRILNNIIKHNNNDTYEDSEINVKLNDTESKDINFSLRTAVISNSTMFNEKNNSIVENVPRWNDIFELNMKNETMIKIPSELSQIEMTTKRNSDNLLKAEVFFKPVEKDYQSNAKNYSEPSTELPKLSFTNNTFIPVLFRPGELPRINIKKDPNSELSFKIKFPLIMNNTDETNNTYDTTLEIPASDNSGSLSQKTYNPVINISDLQISNEFDGVQQRILYSSEGSMIPGVLKLSSTSTTTTTTKPPLVSLKTASRDRYKSRMQPKFSSRYSANSTASKSIIKTTIIRNVTKNISTTNKSLINITSVPDNQQVENATESNVFSDKLSVNSTINVTIASVSEETTLASSSKINNDTDTSKNMKNLRKRELAISDQYDLNDRQELASYFYNGKKIHESYLNYANSIDSELPQDFVQYQDKFNGRSDLSSLGNEVIYQKNQENSLNFGPGYNLQHKPALSFDYSFPNINLKNHVESEVSLPEKETSTVVSVKSHNNIMSRKRKKSRKNILNRKKANSKRTNNRDSKLKKKNNRSIKRKVYRNPKTGKKKIVKTYTGYKNAKARSSTRKRTRNNKIIKNKKKMSNRVRSKKKNTNKRNDNTRFRDSY